ncbi:MAG: endopeptidase La [Bacteroidales bacterium]|nr:endopeptidase La [Bacteroidales bacterium]
MTFDTENQFSNILELSTDFMPILDAEDEKMLDKSPLPKDLPLLPLRDMVLFPGMMLPITVGRAKSLNLIKFANKNDRVIGVVAQRDSDIDEPEPKDFFEVGTIAHIIKVLEMPNGEVTALIQGKRKIHIDAVTSEEPFFRAQISGIQDVHPKKSQMETYNATLDSIRDICNQIYVKSGVRSRDEAIFALKNLQTPRMLLNFVVANLTLPLQEKQNFLEQTDLLKLSHHLLAILVEDLQKLELKNDIQRKVKTEMDKQQREYMLNQQIKTIQEELGDNNNEKIFANLRERAQQKKWPDYVKEVFESEMQKLQRINSMSPEHGTQLNYVETLVDLPWDDVSQDNLNLKKAREVLDRDHYGMEKIKERILEYLAVLKLKGDMKSPILCLVGPPGVGKTSLGRSLADAMGRKYIRMSLGGLRDEAEIRGHRRTYIGAMPGRIIQSLKKVKTSNPVFILDEVDKIIGANVNGDSAAALLEMLDPEQNNTFHDNYLEVDYDLSRILFVATANTTQTIHPALLDRMEIIDLSGYLLEEKLEIAKRHLIPKQLREHGMEASHLEFPKNVVEFIIENYTRESGVRGLEKRIAKVIRAHAKFVVDKDKYDTVLTTDVVKDILGVPVFQKDRDMNHEMPGVVVGLAWTSAGGEVLFIESAISNGEGKFTQTGSLGDVMKESAVLALEYLKSHAEENGIDSKIFKEKNLHIHVPEGATPKDGPSAGVTMLTALASILTQRKVRKDLAMTGEITLRGKVLPVGGIKEKILAAKRANIHDIILPRDNEKDVNDIPKKYLKGLHFHYVELMQEVLDFALVR